MQSASQKLSVEMRYTSKLILNILILFHSGSLTICSIYPDIRLGNKLSRAKLEVSLARPNQADVRLGKAWGSPSRAGP